MKGLSRRTRALALLAGTAVVLAVALVAGTSVLGSSTLEAKAPRKPAIAVPTCSGPAQLDADCWVKRYHGLLHRQGVDAALRELRRAYARGGFIRTACHEVAHAIGHIAAMHLRDLRRAYQRGDPICAGGYYHGATESVMVRRGAGRLKEAMAVCDWLRGAERASMFAFYCAHGMGHGLMSIFGEDVFRSLHECDAVPGTWEPQQCYGGVFMENLMAMRDPLRPATTLRPSEPLYPCTAVSRRYKTKCYEKQTGYALYLRDNDFAEVFSLCARMADSDFRPACHRGLGDRAVVRSTRLVIGTEATAETVRALCMLGRGGAARASCVDGAIQTIVRQHQGVELARAFCASLAGNLKSLCFNSRAAATRRFGGSVSVPPA